MWEGRAGDCSPYPDLQICVATIVTRSPLDTVRVITSRRMAPSRKARIEELIQSAKKFRVCSPSDDPDEQTAVTVGCHHLVTQFQRLAGPILPAEAALHLKNIRVEIENIYTVYDARAKLDAIIPEIQAALEHLTDDGFSPSTTAYIVDPALIARLDALKSSTYDVSALVRMCREINSSLAHQNVLAVALLMRTVLNHVPPVFGHSTFAQVLASVGKSLKESFDHLENGLRKVADFHTHKKIAVVETYPSAAQVEPFKPQFELLLQQVESKLKVP